MNLTLYPFGNAREHTTPDGSYSFICQHGQDECTGNMVEACAMKYHPKTEDHLPFILCLENGENSPARDGQKCAKAQGWSDWTDINTCVNGKEGVALMHAIAQKTGALQPPHTYVPWPVLNGSPLDPDSSDLTQAVCKAYKGSSSPAACKALYAKSTKCMKNDN